MGSRKSYYKVSIILLIIMIFSLLVGCDKSSTGSDDDGVNLQRSVEWPSLADSPWPMWGHDPQRTFRSEYIGPSSFDTSYVFEADDGIFDCGALIGPDDELYLFISYDRSVDTISSEYGYGSVYKIDAQNQLLWRVPVTQPSSRWAEIISTSVLTSDNSLIISAGDETILSLAINGTINWRKTDQAGSRAIGIQLDKGGNFYLHDRFDKLVKSYDMDGNLRWISDIAGTIGDLGPISIDGNSIYVYSKDSLYSLNTSDGEISWRYKSFYSWIMSINSNNNLYFFNDEDTSIISINGKKDISWSIKLSELNPMFDLPCINMAIDPYGNIIFGVTNIDNSDYYIVSLSPAGELNWYYHLSEWPRGFTLIVDAEGKIYFATFTSIICLNNDGTFLWQKKIRDNSNYEIYNLCINSKGELIITLYCESGNIVLKIS